MISLVQSGLAQPNYFGTTKTSLDNQEHFSQSSLTMPESSQRRLGLPSVAKLASA